MSKILIIEDNQLNRDMLSRRLQRKGFDIITAVDGQEGLERMRDSAPDLVLLDMSLPVLDGWQVAGQARLDSAIASIPIIALTAHALDGERERAIAAGCDDYDTKPVVLPRLLAKMEALLG